MNKLYIIKERAFRRSEIYPNEYSDTINELLKKARLSEQIFIHRKGNNIFYLYKKCFSYKRSIAICILSDRLCTDYYDLKKTFQSLISDMSHLGICFKKNTYSLLNYSLLIQRVTLDIFLRDNKNKFNFIFKRATAIPQAKIDIPKGDIVPCVLEERGSSWIVNQITNGYHNIHLSFREETTHIDTHVRDKRYIDIKIPFIIILYSYIKEHIRKIISIICLMVVLAFTVPPLFKSCKHEVPVPPSPKSVIKDTTIMPLNIQEKDNKMDKTNKQETKQSSKTSSDSSKLHVPAQQEIKNAPKEKVSVNSQTVLSDEELLKRALQSRDWKSVKKLADKGLKNAYIPLAKHYLENASTHKLAFSYAKKAQKARINGAEDILKILELHDF